MRITLRRVGRFSSTGTACNLFVYAPLFYVLREYGDTAASLIGLAVSNALAFILQKYWTFKDKDKEALRYQLPLYALMRIIFVLLNAVCLNYVLQHVYPERYVAQAIVLFALGIPGYAISDLIFKERPVAVVPA